jgi:hypothetical protein
MQEQSVGATGDSFASAEPRERFSIAYVRENVFGVRKPCLRFDGSQPCCGLRAGEARLRPQKRERGSRTP